MGDTYPTLANHLFDAARSLLEVNETLPSAVLLRFMIDLSRGTSYAGNAEQWLRNNKRLSEGV